MAGRRPLLAADNSISSRLDDAFDDGHTFATEIGDGTLHPFVASHLVVTSGRLIAADAFIWMAGLELARTVAPGRYPVSLSVAELPNGNRRVAYARVQFQDRTPARWEMAVPAGKQLADLKPDEAYGYPVDSATGCFMDSDSQRVLSEMTGRENKRFNDRLIAALMGGGPGGALWATLQIPGGNGGNLVAFQSGWGDGFYVSYWGLDADDQPVCLVTDFGIVE